MVRVPASNRIPIPLTLTLSHGRGNSRRQDRLFGRFVGQIPRWVVLKVSGGFSRSPRENDVEHPLCYTLTVAEKLTKESQRVFGRIESCLNIYQAGKSSSMASETWAWACEAFQLYSS